MAVLTPEDLELMARDGYVSAGMASFVCCSPQPQQQGHPTRTGQQMLREAPHDPDRNVCIPASGWDAPFGDPVGSRWGISPSQLYNPFVRMPGFCLSWHDTI